MIAMERKVKEPIKLRRKALAGGNVSLYLDIYHKNGKREYEFLKLYLIPETSKADRDKNAATLRLAEAVRARRIVEVQNGDNRFKSDYAEEYPFFDFYNKLAEERKKADSDGNYRIWMTALYHFNKYESNKKITLGDITPQWVQGFKDYLDGCKSKLNGQPLSNNTKHGYFNKLRILINEALRRRMIRDNPMLGIKNFKDEQGTRMYLTIDEMKKLASTDCKSKEVRRAFLFSCLTGLRYSDIKRLKWMDIQRQGDFTRIIFRQKKTHGQEYMDIAEQAARLLGERGKPTDNIFNLPCLVTIDRRLVKWVADAGINKHISFHCARHTFATMMLDLGVDLYTVSKLLGHRKVSTTQIYAKVLDKNKQRAVASIPPIL